MVTSVPLCIGKICDLQLSISGGKNSNIELKGSSSVQLKINVHEFAHCEHKVTEIIFIILVVQAESLNVEPSL